MIPLFMYFRGAVITPFYHKGYFKICKVFSQFFYKLPKLVYLFFSVSVEIDGIFSDFGIGERFNLLKELLR
jgi:hypothetical protein